MKQPLKFSFVLFVLTVFVLSAAVLGSPGATLAQDDPSPADDPLGPGSEQTPPPPDDSAFSESNPIPTPENPQAEQNSQIGELTQPNEDQPYQQLVLAGADSLADGFLYVLDDWASGSKIYGYKFDPVDETLTLLPGFPVDIGQNGNSFFVAERMVYDSTNNRLFVINDDSDTLSGYQVNATSGSLTSMFTPVSLGAGLWLSVCVHPSGSPVVVGDNFGGVLSSFNITASSATFADTDTGFYNYSCEITPDGDYLFAGGDVNGNFSSFGVDSGTGVLSLIGNFTYGGEYAFGMEFDPSNRLFVTNFDSGFVSAFTTSGGVPTAVSGIFTTTLTSAVHAVYHPAGYYMVADRGATSQIGVFKIAGTDSGTTLTAVSGSPFASGVSDNHVLALNQSGNYLYAADGTSRDITIHAVDTGTGELTDIGGVNTGGSGRITGMAFAPAPMATIGNGTLKLGVQAAGDLNVRGPESASFTPYVGLRYVPLNNESLGAGTPKESWGIADFISSFSGFANTYQSGNSNIVVDSFTGSSSEVVSVVTVGTTFEVTHDFHPASTTSNLYEVIVTITNISGDTTEVLYRRALDWDIEPIPFNEFVTIQGTAADPFVILAGNEGWLTSPDPLIPQLGGITGDFVDNGPGDQGATFDFNFGDLPAGDSLRFALYYGAADTEVNALAALDAVGVSVYSFGQPSGMVVPDNGEPNTFIFGFRALPDIKVAPNSLSASLFPSQTANRNFTIDNLGVGDLTVSISDQTTFNLDEGSSPSETGLTEANATWLSVTPTNATISGGADKDFTAKINSTGLTPGTYKADIIIRNNDLFNTTVKVPVTLTVKNYTANFTGSPTSGRVNHTVNFTNSSIGPFTSCLWTFGDGSQSTSCGNPSHTYKKPDTYTVSLKVSGPTSSHTKTRNSYVTVSNVVADFTGSPTRGPVNLTVKFTNKSLGDFTTCTWDFGDGSKSTSCGSPSHTYKNLGKFTVKLTVGGTGYSNTKTRSSYIDVQKASVFVPVSVSNYCGGFNGPNESEPNNDPSTANGPLCFFSTYKGNPNDGLPDIESDWFYFNSSGGPFTVNVTNFIKSDAQLILYYQTTAGFIDNVGDQQSGNYTLSHSGPAGKYLIRLIAGANHPVGSNYNLRVTTP